MSSGIVNRTSNISPVPNIVLTDSSSPGSSASSSDGEKTMKHVDKQQFKRREFSRVSKLKEKRKDFGAYYCGREFQPSFSDRFSSICSCENLSAILVNDDEVNLSYLDDNANPFKEDLLNVQNAETSKNSPYFNNTFRVASPRCVPQSEVGAHTCEKHEKEDIPTLRRVPLKRPSLTTLATLRKASSLDDYSSGDEDVNESLSDFTDMGYKAKERVRKRLIRQQVSIPDESVLSKSKVDKSLSPKNSSLMNITSLANISRVDTSASFPYAVSAEEEMNIERTYLKLKRQAQKSCTTSSRVNLPHETKRTNRVRIHVYDLIGSEVIYPMPWGCHFPLGRCFSVMNSGLHMMGTGAYHVGIEVNGIEYAFGSNNIPGVSGVFTCLPKQSPGYQYRTTLDFGIRHTTHANLLTRLPLTQEQSEQTETFVDGAIVMERMSIEYLGCDYDLLRKNCCTFARDACIRLGVRKDEIPNWFLNLAEAVVEMEDSIRNIDTAFTSSATTKCSNKTDVQVMEISEKNVAQLETPIEGIELILKRKNSIIYGVNVIESEHRAYMKESEYDFDGNNGFSNCVPPLTCSWKC